MMKNRRWPIILLVLVIVLPCLLFGDFPSYNSSNPFSFPVAAAPDGYGGHHFMVFDLDQDGLMDFIYRSSTRLYAYAHDGSSMYSVYVEIPDNARGSTFAVLDIDKDCDFEVVVIDDDDNLVIVDADSGTVVDTATVSLDTDQRLGYVAVANLQGEGEHDIIVQTIDSHGEGNYGYYINRTLYAMDLSTDPHTTLWTVEQDNNPESYYWFQSYDSGYIGQAHGAFKCADIDNDGKDEVVGANMVDEYGTVSYLSYDLGWMGGNSTFVDHIDAIWIGDFRPDRPGLEWIVTQEDHTEMLNPPEPTDKYQWHTVLLSSSTTLWREETTLFTKDDNSREPQNITAGEFDTNVSGKEVWIRSRFDGPRDTNGFLGDLHDYGRGQHPWMFDYAGVELSSYHYNTDVDVLPSGFSGSTDIDYRWGLEEIWTIDWQGGEQEFIAAKSRADHYHVGVFDPTDCDDIWTTIPFGSGIEAFNLYVADISGDSREEIIFYDQSDNKIKVFWNENSNTDTKYTKWDDPLYRRIKQNWNYYSPGGYTQRDPVLLTVKIFLEGPYLGSNVMSTFLNDGNSIPNGSPYHQDLKTVATLPDDIVDWVLIELRSTSDGTAVAYQSAFLQNDGYIVNEEGNDDLGFYVEAGSYYVIIRHRNHLAVMSDDVVALNTSSSTLHDFTLGSGKYYGSNGCINVGDSNWGMVAGDVDQNGEITTSDYTLWYNSSRAGDSGYVAGDIQCDYEVTTTDYTLWYNNARGGYSSSVP